tara:strand:- start:4031 stop:5002 length:972 start_codon:yes stop_codon:yes gene_type:complete
LNKIHFWEFPRKEIYILINKKTRKLLIENSLINTNSNNYYEFSLIINEKSKKYGLKTKFNGGDIKRWLIGRYKDTRTGKIHPKFIPIWVVLELSKFSKLRLKELEKRIISYRSGGNGKIINNPKLPIKVTPEFDSVVIHLFADGYVNNKINTPSYCQRNEEDRTLFITKLKNIFGNFEGGLVENKVFRFPKSITFILSYYYKISSYKTKESTIPKQISNKSKNYKLACILAFILDEGNIRDCICCFNTNKVLLSQIRSLFQDCGYECNPLRYGSNRYWFSMKNRSINKLHEDIIKIQSSYPTCSLGSKYEKFYRLAMMRRSGR